MSGDMVIVGDGCPGFWVIFPGLVGTPFMEALLHSRLPWCLILGTLPIVHNPVGIILFAARHRGVAGGRRVTRNGG